MTAILCLRARAAAALVHLIHRRGRRCRVQIHGQVVVVFFRLNTHFFLLPNLSAAFKLLGHAPRAEAVACVANVAKQSFRFFPTFMGYFTCGNRGAAASPSAPPVY